MTKYEKIKQAILDYMKEEDEDYFDMNDLSYGLKMTASEDFKELVKAVAELERDGDILLSEQGLFSLPEKEDVLEGIFRKNKKGFGFVSVEGMEDDAFIPPTKTRHAMDGDLVKISIDKAANPKEGKSAECSVQKILEHGVTHVIAEYVAYDKNKSKNSKFIGYATPQDKKLSDYRIFIVDKGLQAKTDSIVQVEILDYPSAEHEHSMVGLVTTEIGGKNEPGVDILSVIYKHGIPNEFSKEAMAEAEAIPDQVLEEEKVGRLDLRDLTTITIDGADAKDLDDAISIEKLDNGNYRLGVHIADVSHYVKEGSALDADAYERGTSTYLTDRVVPMLPQKLSNGICSLHPNVERLTLSCIMDIDEQGKVRHYQIDPSVIISDQRMTYEAVNGILEDGRPDLYQKYEDYVTMFEQMRDLHHILEKKRHRRGSINFDTEEAEIVVNEVGQPIDIVMRERGVGERMIESFMLQANETVSEHFNKKKLPILYRVHERPDAEKIQSFIEFASAFGIQLMGKKETVQPKQLQQLLEDVEGKDEEMVISMSLLRSMQQARYDVESLGHFGLAAEYYSHFTSPIRRYPDLILHRMIHHYQEIGTSKKDQVHFEKILPDIAEHCSQAERRSIDAEREVDNMKKVEFMADQVGETFEAVIASVLSFGMFVQLPNTIEGLVHISSMNEDYFEFNEQAKMLVGRRTGKSYRIGEKLEVRLVEANVETYELDFVLAGDEDPSKSGLQGQGGQGQGNRKNKRPGLKNGRKKHDSKSKHSKSQKQTGKHGTGQKKGRKKSKATKNFQAKFSSQSGSKQSQRHFKIKRKK